MLGGIQVNEPNQKYWLKKMKSIGFNSVQVTTYAKQNVWDSDDLVFDAKNLDVIKEIQLAKKKGLKVIFVLRVYLDHAVPGNEFYWHGMIMPRNDEVLNKWFLKYQEFVIFWAKQAQEYGVDSFVIGSELNELTSTVTTEEISSLIRYYLDEKKSREIQEVYRELIDKNDQFSLANINKKHIALREWAKKVGMANNLSKLNARAGKLEKAWKEIIKKVKTHYSGQVSYAANFDQYTRVSFWKELDFIGINAYFPLQTKPDSQRKREEIMSDHWSEILNSIQEFISKIKSPDKKVIFTEIGYTTKVNSTFLPWLGDGVEYVSSLDRKKHLLISPKTDKKDYLERSLALETLYHTYKSKGFTFLSGLFYWKLSTLIEHEEIEPFVHVLGNPEDQRFEKALIHFIN